MAGGSHPIGGDGPGGAAFPVASAFAGALWWAEPIGVRGCGAGVMRSGIEA